MAPIVPNINHQLCLVWSGLIQAIRHDIQELRDCQHIHADETIPRRLPPLQALLPCSPIPSATCQLAVVVRQHLGGNPLYPPLWQPIGSLIVGGSLIVEHEDYHAARVQLPETIEGAAYRLIGH